MDFHTDEKNVCGPQVARFRNRMGLSQSQLAAKCQLAGWDISRDIIARIEGGVRCVGDLELAALSHVLCAPLEGLYPEGVRKFLLNSQGTNHNLPSNARKAQG